MSGLNFQDFNVDVDDVPPFTTTSHSKQNSYQNPNVSGNFGDSSETGTATATKPHFLSFSFYQRYFDVDTTQVQTRILYSFLPIKNSNFITNNVQPIPDLYGPFWICITLIFSIGIFGNFAHYVQDTKMVNYENDFSLVTGATSLILCYVILVPFAIYSFMWKRKSTVQYSYMEVVCAYGYSLAIFIPVSMLWVIQLQWFRWSLIIISVFASGTVLVNTFWPVVKEDFNSLVAFGFIASLIICHALLAIAFKEFYFDTTMPSIPSANTPNAAALTSPMVLQDNIKVAPQSAANLIKSDGDENLELNNNNGTQHVETKVDKLENIKASVGVKNSSQAHTVNEENSNSTASNTSSTNSAVSSTNPIVKNQIVINEAGNNTKSDKNP